MGLDQYLEGRKYYNTWEPKPAREEDSFPVEEVHLRLGYWRKHPNLHGFIVQNYADKDENGQPIDNCHDIELDAANIVEIMEAIKEEVLPETSGFFFGRSDGTEKEEDLQIFGRALGWLTFDHDVPKPWRKSVVYRASW